MKRDPIIILLLAIVVSLMLAFGLHMSNRNADQSASSPDKMKGQPAPEFSLTSLDGGTVHLADFRGKAVLLNFWATWCEPCKIEMPWFIDLQNHYGSQGLQVIGIAMDDSSQQDIAKFAKDMGVNYPILVGKDAVSQAYGGIPFLPSTFYIGRDGKVVDKVFGLKSKSEIEDDIKKALAEGQSERAQR